MIFKGDKKPHKTKVGTVGKKKKAIRSGAPTKYSNRYTPKFVCWLARDGLTNQQIADEIGITSQTLYDWKRTYPEVADALIKGKDGVDREVEDSLLKRALGYDYEKEEVEVNTIAGEKGDRLFSKKKTTTMHVPADIVAVIYWLKNRKPAAWRERRFETNFDQQKGEIADLFDKMKESPDLDLDTAKRLDTIVSNKST